VCIIVTKKKKGKVSAVRGLEGSDKNEEGGRKSRDRLEGVRQVFIKIRSESCLAEKNKYLMYKESRALALLRNGRHILTRCCKRPSKGKRWGGDLIGRTKSEVAF